VVVFGCALFDDSVSSVEFWKCETLKLLVAVQCANSDFLVTRRCEFCEFQ